MAEEIRGPVVNPKHLAAPAWTVAGQRTLDRLREAFARAEFNDDRLAAAGLSSRGGGPDDVWPLRAAAPAGALSVLVRLWMVGAAVDRRDAAAAVAPASLEELEAAGLMQADDRDRVRATVAIAPYGDLLIAADRASTEIDEAVEFVPGVNPVARLLARHTVRVPGRSVLDLGTGNGMQALAAARHAGRVLATDVNPRALAYAALNARLNAISNVRFAEGSWFDPVDDEQFDLITANLPFVVSPDRGFLYRDSGAGPGDVSEAVLHGAARRLAIGGFAHVLCEWGIPPGEEWSQGAREWVAGTGCDALVLRHSHSGVVEHAVAWNHRLVGVDPDRFEEAVERWTVHHRDHGFETLAGATIILRRRDDGPEPWFSALELAGGSRAEAGEHVQRMFAGEDLVRASGDALLSEPLVAPEPLRVDQTLTCREGRWRHRRAKLTAQPGVAVEGRVDPDVLPVLFALDGRPVADVIPDVAARRGADVKRLHRLAHEALPELVRRGLLVSARG